MQTVKPFLKWAGGKRQLLEKFIDYYPRELKNNKIRNYYEPFLGGGAVYFDIYKKYTINNAFLFDINEELIICYKVIKNEVYDLIDILSCIEKEYKKLDTEKRKEYYYDVRNSYNINRFNIDYKRYSDNWKFRAAQIIFLNKTCFNGLMRFNSIGKFNTPMGRYKNPKILDKENLLAVSKALTNALIEKADFTIIKEYMTKDSFVYYDPPYRPISKTSNFTSYSKYMFVDENQILLSELFKELDKNNIFQMLSNSDPKNIDENDNFFDDIYSDYNIYRIDAKRSINSKANKRNEIKEIIVTNY